MSSGEMSIDRSKADVLIAKEWAKFEAACDAERKAWNAFDTAHNEVVRTRLQLRGILSIAGVIDTH